MSDFDKKKQKKLSLFRPESEFYTTVNEFLHNLAVTVELYFQRYFFKFRNLVKLLNTYPNLSKSTIGLVSKLQIQVNSFETSKFMNIYTNGYCLFISGLDKPADIDVAIIKQVKF